jgi:hypothetical protein
MKRNYSALLSVLFIAVIWCGIHFSTMPQWVNSNGSLAEFSTPRALEHIKQIAAKPHYVGSQNHDEVAAYLEKQLQELGLETTVQQGTTLSDWGNLVKSKNIIARIKGSSNNKALLLLSHYDSAPHSFSHGASDDASGVATILEGVRAFLHAKTPHKNDIIILFTDAEELGLNGAALFVTQSKWAKDVGLALNFEARGSEGPGYMLMEVNRGNAAMVKAFTDADADYPVSNSMMYSIYKMLPNDTDLTVFREHGKVPGFNFAFIDGHYNYHTAQDDYAHLSPKTIEHQGTYLMPLLHYFSNADLTNLDSAEDFVYFNTPFNFVSYPFSWVLPMWFGVLGLLLFLIFIGVGKRVLNFREIAIGFLPLFGALLVAGLLTFFGWKILLSAYPQYNDLLNGFTYNGHDYIGAFVFLSLAVSFLLYMRPSTEAVTANYSIAPLLLWICLNLGLALSLPGAGFFIIPVFFSLLSLAYFVVTQSSNRFINLLLAIPSLVVFVPFIVMFPIGLGLKMLTGSAILTALVFCLMLPVFGTFARKGAWSLLMLLVSIGFFVKAHLGSGYEPGKAKSNSLVYLLDADKNKAVWATYDVNPDEWTKSYLGENPAAATSLKGLPLFSKYDTPFSYSAAAPLKNLAKPTIEFLRDSVGGTQRYLKIRISPNRKVNRYDIFADAKTVFHNFKANKTAALGQKGSVYERKNERLLSYYVVANEPLLLEFSVAKHAVLNLSLMESSFDLMSNPQFKIIPRKNWMMPTPFVLNDAVVISERIRPNPKPVVANPVVIPTVLKDTLAVAKDTIKTAP